MFSCFEMGFSGGRLLAALYLYPYLRCCLGDARRGRKSEVCLGLSIMLYITTVA